MKESDDYKKEVAWWDTYNELMQHRATIKFSYWLSHILVGLMTERALHSDHSWYIIGAITTAMAACTHLRLIAINEDIHTHITNQ